MAQRRTGRVVRHGYRQGPSSQTTGGRCPAAANSPMFFYCFIVFLSSGYFLANFERPVLGCIGAVSTIFEKLKEDRKKLEVRKNRFYFGVRKNIGTRQPRSPRKQRRRPTSGGVRRGERRASVFPRRQHRATSCAFGGRRLPKPKPQVCMPPHEA